MCCPALDDLRVVGWPLASATDSPAPAEASAVPSWANPAPVSSSRAADKSKELIHDIAVTGVVGRGVDDPTPSSFL